MEEVAPNVLHKGGTGANSKNLMRVLTPHKIFKVLIAMAWMRICCLSCKANLYIIKLSLFFPIPCFIIIILIIQGNISVSDEILDWLEAY